MQKHLPGLFLAVEGRTDLVVLKKLLDFLEICVFDDFSKGGKGELLKKLEGYNNDANRVPWLVVLDLDQDAKCAPDYLRRVLPTPSSKMLLRIAVHSVESWLMADSGGMARFLQIPAGNFPKNPDMVADPKLFLVDLVRRKSRSNRILQDIFPEGNSERSVGPGYSGLIAEFTQRYWRPQIAAERSDSLARCIRALEDLKRRSVQ